MLYRHYSEVPVSVWRWRNFTPAEIASKGDGSILINEEALDVLQKARDLAGMPFHINSAYRDPVHNAMVGGAPRSVHKTGCAFDISLRGFDKQELIRICRAAGFTGFGVNYQTFLHVDTGRNRSW